MDDGGIVGNVELLQKVWKILQDRGPELGLILNPAKCEWSWLNPSCKDACPIKLEGVADEDQVKLVPHEKIEMLGVPLGDDVFVSAHVERKLLGRLEKVIASLTDFASCIFLAASELQHRAGGPLHAYDALGSMETPRGDFRQVDPRRD